MIISLTGFSQSDVTFLNHLLKNNLNREFESHVLNLDKQGTSSDTTHYLASKYFLGKKDVNRFYENYQLSMRLAGEDSTLVTNASCAILSLNDSMTIHWFHDNNFQFINAIKLKKSFVASQEPQLTNGDFLPSSLQYTFQQYKKYDHRKPVVSGLLSAVVPGLGKLYNGRTHTFWPTLLLNLVNAGRAGESIHRNGIKNIYSIASLGIFSAFYFSNIYGSYYDLKQVKVERRKEFLNEVAQYYYIPNL